MSKVDYDLCVIGGGVNGAGVARDAAGRGLSVLLLEAKDLAQATSSASTKLIHGGLRYLEFFEFNLVRSALKERERLLKIAPHIIWPMEFVLPHSPEQRPFWIIRLGLFLYDHLARREMLAGSKGISFEGSAYSDGLSDRYQKGFLYSDCWVDDSRLVALNAVDAAEHGATILTRTKCTKLVPHKTHWAVSYKSGADKEKTIKAGMVVNAAGPWVSEVIQNNDLSQVDAKMPNIRLVKGSHIILPRMHEGEHAFIMQQDDGRIVFVIPYEHKYTLIGTTEEDYHGDPYDPRLSDEEMKYLCDAYSTHCAGEISAKDVLWSYSGVRPLFAEGPDDAEMENRKVSRDYKLYEHADCDAPMISVFGGKLTTYRALSEKVMERLLHLDNRYAPRWTADKPLPGGDIPNGDFDAFLQRKMRKFSWLPAALVQRYARAYGTRMERFLEGAQSVADLGKHYGDDVYEAEIVYMIAYEFAREAEDVFWRRSKLGLHVSEDTIKAVEKALPQLKKDLLK